ncbi:MAG: glycosyltransferase family 39 protein [Verrucomicrobiales bacterium]|nr:glycosyltransferase family 39 protein [Verrucomicrobiales bacterium]
MRLVAIKNFFLKRGTPVERRFGFVLLLCVVVLGVFLNRTGTKWRDAVDDRRAVIHERIVDEGRQFETDRERDRFVFKSIKVHHFVYSGIYWAAAINLVVACVLLFTRRWWCGRDVVSSLEPSGEPAPGRFWIWVVLAVLIAGGLRWNRMDLSLYNDEAYNFQQYIHGKDKADPNGKVTFRRAGWEETFWENKANNGVLYSVVARLFDEAWRPGDGSTDGLVNERALRYPSLIAGLLSVIAIALLGRVLLSPTVGLAAAFFLAMHPWHLRYSTEARSYAMVILLVTLAMLCLVIALRNNRWRWWLGFAGCQFLYMYAFSGALYFALGTNLAALCIIIARGNSWRRAAIGRLVVASIISAMVYLQLMMPCLPQMAFAIAELDSLRCNLSPARLVDIGSFLAFGMPVFDYNPVNPHNPALEKFWHSGWWMMIPALLSVAVLIFFGALVFRRPGIPRALLAANLLAFTLMLLMSVLADTALHFWYVIFLLPFVVIFAASGWTIVWKSRRLHFLAYALPVLLALVIWRPLRDYHDQSKQSLREAVSLARKDNAVVAEFWSDAGFYDRGIQRIHSAEDLQRYAAAALEANRDFSVIFGHRQLALASMEECVRITEGMGNHAFQKVGEFYGLEESQFNTFVYRLSSRDPERR